MGRSGGLVNRNDHLVDEFLAKDHIEVLPNGDVYSHHVNRVLRGCISTHGYRKYTLKINNKNYRVWAHRVVYKALKGNLEPDLVISHLDGNPLNNNPNNLELTTQSENNKNSFKTGRKPTAAHRKITPEIAKRIRYMHKNGITYKEILQVVGPMYGIRAKSTISYIINKKTWNKDVTVGARVTAK